MQCTYAVYMHVLTPHWVLTHSTPMLVFPPPPALSPTQQKHMQTPTDMCGPRLQGPIFLRYIAGLDTYY